MCWWLWKRKGWWLWCSFVLAQIHVGIPRSMHCWHCSESYHFVGFEIRITPNYWKTKRPPHYLLTWKIATQIVEQKKPWKYLECQLYTVLLQLKMTCYGGKSTSAIHSKRSHFLSLQLFTFTKVFCLSKAGWTGSLFFGGGKDYIEGQNSRFKIRSSHLINPQT